jgi:tetratricopeptide (TPR) repeat protein
MQLTHRQAEETRSTREGQAKRKCESARALENLGDYEGARQALGGLWSLVGERPRVDGLPADTRSEVLLRTGTLTGYLGSALQIDGAQEIAKDLLSESLSLFAEIGDTDRCAEARAALAVCYWREGAMDEARINFSTALEEATEPARKVRVLINSTLPEVSNNRLNEAMRYLDQAGPLLDQVAEHSVKGSYHMQRALVLKRLGGNENLDRALVENTAASVYFERAGHKRYLARVENNIGSLLLELERFQQALEHLDKARAVFVNLKDSGSVAQVNETRARVFLAQGRYTESDRAAFSAASALEHGGESALLAEALTTQGISRARLGRYRSAREIFARAAGMVADAGDTENSGSIYLTAMEELHRLLPPIEVAALYSEADARLSKSTNHSERLRSGARITVSLFRDHLQSVNQQRIGGDLREEVKRYEAEIIRNALDQTGGRITKAAQLLGMSHQALSDLIKGKHKALQSARTPRRPRRKSIIKKR